MFFFVIYLTLKLPKHLSLFAYFKSANFHSYKKKENKNNTIVNEI